MDSTVVALKKHLVVGNVSGIALDIDETTIKIFEEKGEQIVLESLTNKFILNVFVVFDILVLRFDKLIFTLNLLPEPSVIFINFSSSSEKLTSVIVSKDGAGIL